jgi:Ca-activated chloride channel family protein
MQLFGLIFFMFNSAHAILDYERAILQTQKNNWSAAQELLTKVIVENPERPDALYDMGVASYKNNNFDAALSYFNKAAHHAQANSALQQQAHFNSGNTHVQLKQLHEAIDAYDRVLALKPDHTQALHNKEVVKKMLEQQKQEQQQDKDQNKDDQQKDQDNQDKQNKDNKQEQPENKDDQNQKDQQEKDKKDSKNQDQQSKKDQEKKEDQKNSDQSDDNKSNEKNDESGANQKDNGQSPQQEKSGSQQDKDVQKTKPRDGDVAQSDQKPGQPEQKLSAGLARVLEDREKKDAQLNKRLTKALVATQGGSKNDYNCW